MGYGRLSKTIYILPEIKNPLNTNDPAGIGNTRSRWGNTKDFLRLMDVLELNESQFSISLKLRHGPGLLEVNCFHKSIVYQGRYKMLWWAQSTGGPILIQQLLSWHYSLMWHIVLTAAAVAMLLCIDLALARPAVWAGSTVSSLIMSQQET